MSKIISFFLASSIVDLSEDRIAIGDFINQLNNIYQPSGTYIKLYKCEDDLMDHSIIIGGTQKTLDELVAESDLCFVLFWRKAGNVTEHELKVAFKSFQEKNRPKIVVYFKNITDNGLPVSEEVCRVMHMIDNEMLHYHREYAHIDSLKLGIITQLQVLGFMPVDIKVEKGEVTVNGQTMVSTRDLPLFSKNEEYLSLLEQLKQAEEDCERLLQLYQENRGDSQAFFAYKKRTKERDRLLEDISEMANGMLNIGRQIAEISSSAITERIQKAIKCFDLGDYQGVLDVLTPEEMECRTEQLDHAEEQIHITRKGIIEEYRLRILALEAQGRWSDVYETYCKAIEQIERYSYLPKSVIFEFAKYLFQQRKYKESINVCEKLKDMALGMTIDLGAYEIADILDLLGMLYFSCMRFDEAESVLLEALKLRRSSSKRGAAYDVMIAETSVRLAKVYFIVNRHFEAESLYLQALKLYSECDDVSVGSIDVSIAKASCELGDLYYMINRHSDAARLFYEAYQKYRELVEYGKKSYCAELAKAGNKLSYLYIAISNHKNADRYYVDALKVKQYLSKKEPSVYFCFLKRICERLSELWYKNGRSDNADKIKFEAERIQTNIECKSFTGGASEDDIPLDETFYNTPLDKVRIEGLCKESVQLFYMLARDNPEAFESPLAQSYNILGMFYSLNGERKLAEYYYAEAIKLCEILFKREPTETVTQLAGVYSNLASHYSLCGQNEKAEKYGLMSIDLYSSVTQKNAGAFDTDLARNYHQIANYYTKSGNEEDAERYYIESMLLYVKLFEKSPRAYVDRIINTVADITMFFDPIESADFMRDFSNTEELSKWL